MLSLELTSCISVCGGKLVGERTRRPCNARVSEFQFADDLAKDAYTGLCLLHWPMYVRLIFPPPIFKQALNLKSILDICFKCKRMLQIQKVTHAPIDIVLIK